MLHPHLRYDALVVSQGEALEGEVQPPKVEHWFPTSYDKITNVDGSMKALKILNCLLPFHNDSLIVCFGYSGLEHM